MKTLDLLLIGGLALLLLSKRAASSQTPGTWTPVTSTPANVSLSQGVSYVTASWPALDTTIYVPANIAPQTQFYIAPNTNLQQGIIDTTIVTPAVSEYYEYFVK